MLSPTIETKRLILRRYKELDLDMAYETLCDDRLHDFIKFPCFTKSEELDCIKKWIKEADIDNYEKWVIELKDNNISIGNISVNNINKKNNYCNVGYVILYDYWNIETKRLILRKAKISDLDDIYNNVCFKKHTI